MAFRRLSEADGSRARALFIDHQAFDQWHQRWQARLAKEDTSATTHLEIMRLVNPAYVPRNHRVEEVIVAALAGDFAPFHKLVQVLEKPFEDQPEFAEYQTPPLDTELVNQTFCGT